MNLAPENIVLALRACFRAFLATRLLSGASKSLSCFAPTTGTIPSTILDKESVFLDPDHRVLTQFIIIRGICKNPSVSFKIDPHLNLKRTRCLLSAP